MDYGQIENAYKRIFGQRWDKMTEEERMAAMKDPAISGRLEAQRDIYMRNRADARNRAFREEQERARSRNAGPGVMG